MFITELWWISESVWDLGESICIMYVVEVRAWSFFILIMTYPIYNCKLCGRIQKIWNAGTFLKTKPQRQVPTFKAEQKTGLTSSFAHHRYQLSTAASGKIYVIFLLVDMIHLTLMKINNLSHCFAFLQYIEYYCYFDR